MDRTRLPQKRAQQGVMLLEALIGILIFSIGILALIGMQATAMRTTMIEEIFMIVQPASRAIIGRMWVDRANLASYATPAACPAAPSCAWIDRVSALLPNATGGNAPEIVVTTDPVLLTNEITVTLRWQPPGDTTVSNHVAVTQINGS